MTLDPHFPQMADALNPAVMGPLLRWVLNMPGITPGHVECCIGEKRHKPGKSLVIAYRLNAQSDPIHQSRYVTGRLCPPGTEGREFEWALSKRPDLAAGALTFLHEPAMLIWAFPYDPKLIHLPALLAAESIKNRIGEQDLTGDDRVLAVESDVLHYLAERSCMIRYRVSLGGADETRLLYAKNYADDSGRDVFAVMQQLSSQFAWGAKALAYDLQTRTLWQAHVPGRTLCWADLQTAEALAERIGQCAAAFHACKIDTAQRFNQSDVTEGLLATVRLAEQTRPELAERIESAVAALLVDELNLPKPAVATLHHDLKLNNFLVDGDKLGLIDMDCVCLGDPMADLASLIGNFYLHGLREGDSVEQVHPLVKQLVRSYMAHSVHALSLPALRWQVAAALIHEVTRRSLRQMDDLRIAHIQSYLALSENYLALSRHPTGFNDVLI
ncbi:aminoglycoside phosphotransferase family protein [Methylomonas rosea]|uniref:Aminoglycoside phosphotransferase family protein n=1 Tax=Methylomonas rosea TaxID=2952227 RepID=A0ABT1TVG5_9GAMM|nr:aminoglycoside phosphotransferase family protein [Methylomonas sp. WSC-7]MCQ8118598.1 aminoglycoside phosphotransferase family protein [Methylomonas sp. WSC-7]